MSDQPSIYRDRGYVTATVIPDASTRIEGDRLDSTGQALVHVGGVTIVATPDVLDRLHEAITRAFELTSGQVSA